MTASCPSDESIALTGTRASTRESAISAHDPRPGGLRSLLLAIGVALFAIGVGCLVLGLGDEGLAASTSRAEAGVAPPQEPGSAPARSHSGGSRRATPYRRPPPMPAARPWHAMDGPTFGAARAFLLEMSARLRHTTQDAWRGQLHAAQEVAADVTCAWLEAIGAAPAQPGAPRCNGRATPTAVEPAATPAPRRRESGLPGSE
jgi:hypothetical protein